MNTPGAELALPIDDTELADRLRARMATVEEALYGHASSRAPYVTEAARHLLAAGGKRFRPLLVLLAAEAGPRPDADEVLTAACVVEGSASTTAETVAPPTDVVKQRRSDIRGVRLILHRLNMVALLYWAVGETASGGSRVDRAPRGRQKHRP